MRRSHAAALIRLVCITLAITLWGGGPAADGAAGALTVAATVVGPGRLRRALAAAETGRGAASSEPVADPFRAGFALLEEGHLDAAVPLLRRAAEENARDADALYHLADALARLDRLDEADVTFARAVLLRPRDAAIRGARGALLARLGRRDVAIAELRQALALRPQLLAARQLLERLERDAAPARQWGTPTAA